MRDQGDLNRVAFSFLHPKGDPENNFPPPLLALSGITPRKGVSRQTWRHQARIENADGFLCWQPVKLALSLIDSGLATLQFTKPMIVRLIGVKRVGNARIPDDCKNFIEEYVATAGYRFDSNHRTRRPRGAVEHVHLDDGYIPLPTDFGR